MNIFEQINSTKNIAIFGAQAIAYGFACALIEVFSKYPECFIVSKKEGNPENLDGVNVLTIEEALFYRNHLIVIAVPGYLHNEILTVLKNNGFNNFLLLDSHAEYEFMSLLFRKRGKFKLLEDISITSEVQPDVKIFMAKSAADKPLSGTYSLCENIIPVHAGAVLSDKHICDVTDAQGDNISRKNRDYSELTVTYWAWKNVSAAYKGICHYRRMLVIEKDDFKRLNNIDVVLPLPFVCCPPDVSTQYNRYLNNEDFTLMMKLLSETEPLYYKTAEVIFKGQYLYNQNMLIAKENVFNGYCFFLFGILEKIDEYYLNIGRKREDRYSGYIGELLTSIYFMHNADNLRIAHAKKLWLV